MPVLSAAPMLSRSPAPIPIAHPLERPTGRQRIDCLVPAGVHLARFFPFTSRHDPMLKEYFPVLMQALIATGLASGMLIMSVLLGRSAKRNATKDSPYECGMLPLGEAQPRFSVKFYLVAMLFVLFDIEVVFMYPWAVSFQKLLADGSAVFWSMAGFAGILLAAYVYALKKGALKWND